MSNLKRTLIHGLEHGLKGQYRLSKVIPLQKGFKDELWEETLDIHNLPFFINHCKPYLFPLSALTKEIEIGGERFVPIEFFEVTDDHRTCPLEQDHGNIKVIKDLKAISKNNVSFDIQFLPLWVVEKLRSWHFNVDNLSPDEFIRVDEINNPYK